MDAVRQEYRASLADLTFNSRPIIMTLTTIAQESTQFAPAIVQAIQDHLRVVQPVLIFVDLTTLSHIFVLTADILYHKGSSKISCCCHVSCGFHIKERWWCLHI